MFWFLLSFLCFSSVVFPQEMTTVQKINAIESFEIPRPKCVGMKFVSVCGRHGYYQTVNKSVAIKYGLSQQQRQQKRRPMLPNEWVQSAQQRESDEEQRQLKVLNGIDKLGKKRDNAAAERSVTEPTPDYDEEPSADKISVPNGNAPPAPPLSLILRQSLLGNQKMGGHSTIRQEMEKRQNSFEKMADGVANALLSSTFRNENPKKVMLYGDGGPTNAKPVVDVRL